MKFLFEGDYNVGVIGQKALTNGVMGVHSKRFLIGASSQIAVIDFRGIDYDDADGFMKPSHIEFWGDNTGFEIRLISVCDNSPEKSLLIGTMRDNEKNIDEVEWEYYAVSPLNDIIISFTVVIGSKLEVIDEEAWV